jgi:hypothetical protein
VVRLIPRKYLYRGLCDTQRDRDTKRHCGVSSKQRTVGRGADDAYHCSKQTSGTNRQVDVVYGFNPVLEENREPSQSND